MKEMGRKPYLSDSYYSMMHSVSNASIWNQIKQKHSEFEKPYLYKAGEYAEMQHYYPNLPGLSFTDIKFDHPWMNEQVPNVKAMKGVMTYSFPGCEFEFPGLFSGINRCEIKCEVLDERSRWYDGTPTDPIVSWEAKNGTITESDMYHACVRANEDAPYGQWVELIATTKSGATCSGFAWVEGNDCEECDCTGISIGYTTQQMQVNEEQTLSVVGAVEGCVYNWEITAGGGSLSAATGLSVDYTAPATNPECANNPTIILSVGGNQCDSLAIAVNADSGSAAAYELVECVYQDPYWRRRFTGYRCTGVVIGTTIWGYYNTGAECESATNSYYCPCVHPPGTGIKDCRDCYTPSLKDSGCCPAELL